MSLATISATSRVRRSSMPPSSTEMRLPARSSTVLRPSGLPLAARKLMAACSVGTMYISLDRSSVQKMPVLIMSQRLAARPGIMVANSVRIYSGASPSRLQHSSASSTRMPFSWPLSSTYCRGGNVGLIDMISVPALMMVGGAIFGWARSTPGTRVIADAAAAAPRRPRRWSLMSLKLFMISPGTRSPRSHAILTPKSPPCPGMFQTVPHQPVMMSDTTSTARR